LAERAEAGKASRAESKATGNRLVEGRVMNVDRAAVAELEAGLDASVRERVEATVERVVAAKESGGRVVVVTGSGPNIHEGVTTLIAELMRLGVVDGVTTSSAVVAHEMGGVLDKVKRVDGTALDLPAETLRTAWLPRGGTFELSLLPDEVLAEVARDMAIDEKLLSALREAPGEVIVKAAGNLGYPMGLYLERLSSELVPLARERGQPLETVVGAGADPRTMIGVGARADRPVLVTIPQLVGGGAVGLAIGDSLSTTDRAERIAAMLGEADVVIESAVALTQEVHDGPFELYTGHGLWAAWGGRQTYSLEGKTLVRIDLDPALEQVWQVERDGRAVQEAIDKGLPKAKLFEVPFRMEMSGFARLEGSLPVVGDIGVIWPVLALRVAERLGLTLEILSYPQETPRGQEMREWIVETVRPVSRRSILEGLDREPAPREVGGST
jgi:hypothetical protein